MIEGVINGDGIAALERMLQFAGARHRVLAHNIANIDTPNFRPVDVSVEEFQAKLGEAIDRSRDRDGNRGGSLEVEATRTVEFGPNRVTLRPEAIGDNILFHDGNDRDPDRLMQSLVENFMAFRMAADLMKSRFDQIRMAIRERV